jgi:hypothetical protein
MVASVGRKSGRAFRHCPRHTPLRVGLSPQSGSGWSVLVHGQLARPSLRPIGDANSHGAGRSSAGAAPGTLPHRRLGSSSRPYALPADLTGRRCRLPRSLAWIKTAFSKALPARESRSPAMTSRGKRGIWRRRYWEHTIRDDRDFAARLDYTHFNPVKPGLVTHPADWPHSSFRRCVAKGLYPAGWIGGNAEPLETGERR